MRNLLGFLMNQLFLYLSLFAIGSVVVVLGVGIYSLMRGGGFGAKWSNKLMRLRVLLQAIAIMCLIAFALLSVKS